MGLAARPGRGVPAVHHAHETPADRRIPGWRTGPEPVGSAVSAVHVSAARGAPGSGSCSGILKDCNIAAVTHGFRSMFRELAAEETDHPREVVEAAPAHVVGNKVEAAYARPDLFERRRRLMDDWKPAFPASARGCRRPPGGSNDSMPRGSRPRATPRGPCPRNAGPGGSRANRFRAPAGGRVGIEHEPCYHCAGTTPRRWSAVLVDGDRDALHRDRVVVPPAPVLPLLTPCQVERLACTHSRPIRPRSGFYAEFRTMRSWPGGPRGRGRSRGAVLRIVRGLQGSRGADRRP